MTMHQILSRLQHVIHPCCRANHYHMRCSAAYGRSQSIEEHRGEPLQAPTASSLSWPVLEKVTPEEKQLSPPANAVVRHEVQRI